MRQQSPSISTHPRAPLLTRAHPNWISFPPIFAPNGCDMLTLQVLSTAYSAPPINKAFFKLFQGEKNSKIHSWLINTLKMCGTYGVTFASVGGLYIGVEQLMQKQRMKTDFVNGTVGGFVAGATIYGYRGKSIKAALFTGSLLPATSAFLDAGGRTYNGPSITKGEKGNE